MLSPARGRRTEMDQGQSEVARFLARRPPFDALAADELGALVRATELEFHIAGSAILTEDGGPVTFLRVIHSGAVDIVHDGRLLDLLGAGDSLGHDAMLAGLPPGFEARAAEDTLCYRIPAGAARPLLDRARDRYLAVGSDGPAQQPVGSLIRTRTVRCETGDTVGVVALRMTDAGATAAIVEVAPGQFGIVTDRDLRSRVLAAGRSAQTPVEEVMTSPVFTVTPDQLGAEVMFELLERGIHHAPVVTTDGRLIGLVEDGDLFAIRQRSWFGLRRAIGRARDVRALAQAAARLPQLIAELHTGSLGGLGLARVHSALRDGLIVQALELATAAAGGAPDGLVWLALGAHARRELAPAEAPIGVVVCGSSLPPQWQAAAAEALAACDLPAVIDARTTEEWESDATHDPIATMVLADRRLIYGTPAGALPELREPVRQQLVTALATRAKAPVPTGFDVDGLLAADGNRSSRLRIGETAVEPIAAIARWAGAAAGANGGSTVERLLLAASAGVLDAGDAGALCDAFTAAFELHVVTRLDRIAAGGDPDAPLPPSELSAFTRDQLRDVFRTITAVQRQLP